MKTTRQPRKGYDRFVADQLRFVGSPPKPKAPSKKGRSNLPIEDDMQEQKFGCERCWPSEADKAWDLRSALEKEFQLIDESHFGVKVLKCSSCSQQFLSVFTERVDWAGEDPMYWTTLPISPSEAKGLLQHQPISEGDLNALGQMRRCLRRDFPKAEPERTYWSEGITVGPHD